jgi:adenine deaminase
MTYRSTLLAVARGEAEPDLVIEGARVFSAFTKEWLDGDVAICGSRIAGVGRYDGGRRLDGSGRHLVPGFIDAHVHIESSKLAPAEFARAVVARGTTAVVCDPHEIANVLGVEGVHWLLEAAASTPLRVFACAPSCVPASPNETPKGELGTQELRALLAHPRVLRVAEMMNFPGVVRGDASELAKLELTGTPADGHAPGLAGAELDAYVAAGIATDHEATTYDEALERRRRGMWVLIREASNARNLEDLIPLVQRFGPDRCAFCTDDREPTTLATEGHLDGMCRQAVQAGIAAEDVLLLASTNAARCHGLTGLGAIAPGYQADLVLLEDLQEFRASHVLQGGRVVAVDGVCAPVDAPPAPSWVTATMNVGAVEDRSLEIEVAEQVRVIEIVPGQLLTRALTVEPTVRDDRVVADPDRDLAKLAVFERHHASGRVGIGLVRGFGLQAGAFASTVAHDAHNVVAVGVSDADILRCVSCLVECGGGLAVVRDGVVEACVPLPIAGLMAEASLEEVARALTEAEAALRASGVTLESPFMALSFLALSVIPELKLTDRGLVDVVSGRLVPIGVQA